MNSDLIKGDLDSLRADVRDYYSAKGVPVIQHHDQGPTDLMKCVHTFQEKEKAEGQEGLDSTKLSSSEDWRGGWTKPYTPSRIYTSFDVCEGQCS
ncbi:hypothetical protein SCLCIDRAFT_20315 [Scleroderma citrinum Foug A]|uniref:Thiamin pyrophosphokinase catalytic domain-containing protein n=1 Tax=Scleroderma citrinum Foug A TaxID=1036808 RepID=A0A0C3ATW0_9AGAM|nr:hypothetical protein SCLCIDRAFT_20315 [Scleroderma citrinum Foug A]